MCKNSGSGSGMNDPDHISECFETIFGLKYLNYLIRNPGWKELGSGMEKIGIRDKHPVSATLMVNIVIKHLKGKS
jgi:hypothetical protein